jgi:hypothetical protein
MKETFYFINPNGGPVININEWVGTLPENEQQEYHDALSRQFTLRQSYVDSGALTVIDTGYIWRDHEAWINNKPHDPVWDKYFARYLKETGTIFKKVIEE